MKYSIKKEIEITLRYILKNMLNKEEAKQKM
jgi:hypothetical protein